MSTINFKSVSYKNFKSVGNSPIKISLDKHHVTLLSGKNGAGKSTFLSAICFGLFGRGYGSANKPALVNSINQKQLLVELEFSIGKKNYRVVRGIKPNIFEIFENGKLINQDPSVRDYQKILEQRILKFNYRAFSQVIAVGGGSDYTPFMRLSTKDRREFVEDLLDIRVFSIMNAIVKESTKESKDSLKSMVFELKSLKEKIALQNSFIKKLTKEREVSTENISSNIKLLETKNNKLTTTLNSLMLSLEELEHKVTEHDELDEELSDILSHTKQLNKQIITKTEKQSYYEGMTTCPTCNQEVPDIHKHKITEACENELIGLKEVLCEHESKEKHLSSLLSSYKDALIEYSSIQKEISELNKEIFSNTIMITTATKNLTDMQGNTQNVDDEIKKLREFATEYLSLDARKKDILVEQQYQEYLQQILSDAGIKAKIIHQYIPTINKLINKFLSELDFFCAFYLNESFEETIKSRHRDTFTYEHFSEGQKRRIDLAILLTWMEIAKAKNSVNTNIGFFDEMDNCLDKEGADLFLHSIKTSGIKNIFIISHKADLLADKVDDSIVFELKNNFTEIVTH